MWGKATSKQPCSPLPARSTYANVGHGGGEANTGLVWVDTVELRKAGQRGWWTGVSLLARRVQFDRRPTTTMVVDRRLTSPFPIPGKRLLTMETVQLSPPRDLEEGGTLQRGSSA